MNASDLKAVADEVNAEKTRKKELPLEALMARAERAAREGSYSVQFSEWSPEHGNRDWLSQENRKKLLERGFWFGGEKTWAHDYSYSIPALHWDKKPWWRFW